MRARRTGMRAIPPLNLPAGSLAIAPGTLPALAVVPVPMLLQKRLQLRLNRLGQKLLDSFSRDLCPGVLTFAERAGCK